MLLIIINEIVLQLHQIRTVNSQPVSLHLFTGLLFHFFLTHCGSRSGSFSVLHWSLSVLRVWQHITPLCQVSCTLVDVAETDSRIMAVRIRNFALKEKLSIIRYSYDSCMQTSLRSSLFRFLVAVESDSRGEVAQGMGREQKIWNAGGGGRGCSRCPRVFAQLPLA